jgi:hypothetical protein
MRAIGDVFVGFDGQFVFSELGCGFLFFRRRVGGEEGREEQRGEEEVRPPGEVGMSEVGLGGVGLGGVGVRKGDHGFV